MKKLLLALLLIPCIAFAEEQCTTGCEDLLVWNPLTVSSGIPAGGSPDNCSGGETIGNNHGSEGSEVNMGGGDAIFVSDSSGSGSTWKASCTGDLDTAYIWHHGGAIDNAILGVFLDDGDFSFDSGDTKVALSAAITSDGNSQYFSAAFASGSVTKDSYYWFALYADVGTAWKASYYDVANEQSDYDSSCDGYASASGWSEITASGACSFSSDDSYDIQAYVTLAAP